MSSNTQAQRDDATLDHAQMPEVPSVSSAYEPPAVTDYDSVATVTGAQIFGWS